MFYGILGWIVLDTLDKLCIRNRTGVREFLPAIVLPFPCHSLSRRDVTLCDTSPSARIWEARRSFCSQLPFHLLAAMDNGHGWYRNQQQASSNYYYHHQQPQQRSPDHIHNSSAALDSVQDAQALLAVYPPASATPTAHGMPHMSCIALLILLLTQLQDTSAT